MSRCEVDKNLMPGVALQPLVGLTPNWVLILFGLRRSGPRRLIQNQIGEFTTKSRVEKWGWLLHFLSGGLPRTTHPPVQFKCAGVLFDP